MQRPRDAWKHRPTKKTLKKKRSKSMVDLQKILTFDTQPPQDKASILIKFPTRLRPKKFIDTLTRWVSLLSKTIPVKFLISIDEDDKSMTEDVLKKAKDICTKNKCTSIEIRRSNNKSKVEAVNDGVWEAGEWDILILCSDDMAPRYRNFDYIIASHMTEAFPFFDGILHYDDGYWKNRLSTYSIFGRNWYRRFGYVYHPEYVSFGCDNEYTEAACKLVKRKYHNIELITHMHPKRVEGHKLDALNIRDEKNRQADYQLLLKRRKITFDLEMPQIGIMPVYSDRTNLNAWLREFSKDCIQLDCFRKIDVFPVNRTDESFNESLENRKKLLNLNKYIEIDTNQLYCSEFIKKTIKNIQ